MPTHGPPYRVFISRTDEAALAPYADAAVDAVMNLSWYPIDFKDWGARDQTAVDTCRTEVTSCDILVVLVGHRYGWVPPPPQGDSETSITRWEVRWAQEAALTVLAYIVKPNHPWPPDQIDRGSANADRLESFKAELQQDVVCFFESVPEFKARLTADLARVVGPHPRPAVQTVEPRAPTPPPATSYTYKTFKVTIARTEGGGEVARVTESPEAAPPADAIALDASVGEMVAALWSETGAIAQPLRRATLRDTVPAARLPSADAVKSVGERLYAVLFGSALRDSLEQSLRAVHPQKQEGLRVVLEIPESSVLAEVPWEFLRDPVRRDFLFTDPHTPLVRWLRVNFPAASLAVTPPLRLLLVAAAPSDEPAFQAGDELARLDHQLSELKKRGRVQIRRLEHATREQLDLELTGFKPHILHFIGHGGFDDGGFVVLEKPDALRSSDRISAERFAVLLRLHLQSLRLVFLNSCVTAAASHRSPFGGVAQNLVRRGVPAVVAMQFPIPDAAAVVLAEHFYRYVADGRPIDASLTSARASLYAAGYEVEWGAPVLYMQSLDGRLFDGLSVEAVPVAAPSEPSSVGTVPIRADSPIVAHSPAPGQPAPVVALRRPLRWSGPIVAVAAAVTLAIGLSTMLLQRQSDGPLVQPAGRDTTSQSKPPQGSPTPTDPLDAGRSGGPPPGDAAQAERALSAVEAAAQEALAAGSAAQAQAERAIARAIGSTTNAEYAAAAMSIDEAWAALSAASLRTEEVRAAVDALPKAIALGPPLEPRELDARLYLLDGMLRAEDDRLARARAALGQQATRIAFREPDLAERETEEERRAAAARAEEERAEAARKAREAALLEEKVRAEAAARAEAARAEAARAAAVLETIAGARDAAAVMWLAEHPDELVTFRANTARFDERERHPDRVTLLVHLPSGTAAPGFPASISQRELVQIVTVVPALGTPTYDLSLDTDGCDVKSGSYSVTFGNVTAISPAAKAPPEYRLVRAGAPFICPRPVRYALNVRPAPDAVARQFQMSLRERPIRHVRPTILAGVDFTRRSTFGVTGGRIRETTSTSGLDALAGVTYHVTGLDAGGMRPPNYVANPFVAVSLSAPTTRFAVGTSIMHPSGVALNVGATFNRVVGLAAGVAPGDAFESWREVPQQKKWTTGAFVGVGVNLPLDIRRR